VLLCVFGITIVALYNSAERPKEHMCGTYIMAAASLGLIGFSNATNPHLCDKETIAHDYVLFVLSVVAAYGGKFYKDAHGGLDFEGSGQSPHARDSKKVSKKISKKVWVGALVMAIGQSGCMYRGIVMSLKLCA